MVMRKVSLAVIVVCLVAAALWLVASRIPAPEDTPIRAASEDAGLSSPADSASGGEFRGALLAGQRAPLVDFTQGDYEEARASGKLIVLYFYANWCPVCKRETADALYPAFNELMRGDVIGFRVSYNDNETSVEEKELAREFGVGYQHTKVFVKNGERILKSPEGWDKARYISEINAALNL